MAALINTPGLMALIILNIGLDLAVIPPTLFSLLMASSLLKNLSTTPILHGLASKGLPRLGSATAESWEPVRTGTVQPTPVTPMPSQVMMSSQRPPQG